MCSLARLLCVLVAVISAASAHAKPPAWLTAVAAKPATMDYGTATHAVLLDESVLDVDKNGIITRRTRSVIRVLTRDGRDAAFARLSYESSSDKVKSFLAWLIPPSGSPIDYRKKEIIDTAVYSNARELYGESRQLIISAYRDATPGSVFGFEAVTVETSIYSQEFWSFQQKVPVESSSLTLNLPEGWTAQTRLFNHEPIAPIVNGRSQTWELRALPAATSEPLAPPTHARLPWLALDLRPPAGAKTIQRLSFPSWSGLSAYFSSHYESAAAPDAAMKARADALVSGATSPWERIVRLCRFAQAVNYISINLNAREAGGMIPRAATRVYQCNYGDCKDKTTLLRSLLRTQGIESYPVIAYSGDATYVRPEWISPMQFNHCIVAIKVDSSIDAPGVIVHPTFGHLLIFDPTNEFTPPGWLAREVLDGLGLILAAEHGELIQLPSMRPADNRFERVITARLDAAGAITGTIAESFRGNSSATIRQERRSVSETAYRTDIIEPWLGRSLPTARATRVESADDFNDAKLSLTIDFTADNYGKVMRDTLLVFKPVMVARRESTLLKKGTRTQPIVIVPHSFSEHTEIDFPDGFGVDEPFITVELNSSFGTYTARAEVRDQRLVFERVLELRAVTLPATDYETARVFFERILQAEQSPVVLKRL